MVKFVSVLMIALLTVSFLSTLGLIHSARALSGIVYSVAITLRNTQSVPTASPFQQMIQVDSAQYSQYEASNLQNVEFYDSNGMVIPSWLESGNSNTATDTIYWLNLPSIPANSQTAIYMGFASSSVNLFNTQKTGEAPQLSPTYGEYDDGANVFTSYQGFASSNPNPPPGWYSSGLDNPNWGWTYVSFQDDWHIGNVNGNAFGNLGYKVAYAGSDIPINNQLAIDIEVTYLQTYGTNWQAPFVNSASPTSYVPQGDAVTWLDNNAAGNTFNAGATFSLTSGPGGSAISSSSGTFPQDVITVTDTSVSSNYTTVISNQNGILANSGYLALSTLSSSAYGSVIQGYWVRTRACPPNGVMPTASSTSVTCSPNSVSVGSSVTCTATVSGSNPTGTVKWSTSSSTGEFNQTSVSLISGSCSVTYIDSNVGTVTITAEYGGDPNNAKSKGEAKLTITAVDPTTSFSIFWITDTQYLSESLSESSNEFTTLTRWIVNNAATYNLQMVVHTGDIINGTDSIIPDTNTPISVDDQWKCANASMYTLLENNIPYCWCAGNHDDNIYGDSTSGWTGNNFDGSSNTAFNPSVVSAKEHKNWVDLNNEEYAAVADGENTAVNFTSNGLNFLIVNIEWDAPIDLLNSWVAPLLSKYSGLDYQIIVTTHAYINPAGITNDQNGPSPNFINTLTTLLDKYPKVFLTLNGHFGTDFGFEEKSSNGNRWQLMFDRQDVTDDDEYPNGAAAVTILTFNIAEQSQMEARTIDLNQNSGKGAFLSPPFNPTPSNYEDAFVVTLPLSIVRPLYSVVRGLDDRIYYGDWMVLPGSTIDSPAAAMLGNDLHIVVRGSDGNSLWCGYLTDPADPESFSGWTLLSGATNSAPTLTSNGTALCLVVRGLDNRVYYCCYSEGVWGQWYAVPTGATPDAPAACMLGNDLHIVVRGMDGSSLWDTIVSCEGTVVRGWNLVSGATPSKPVLACSGADNLCLVVEGMDNAIYYRSYTGSTDSWGDWSALPTGATIDGPAATVVGSMLCMVVRGSDGNTLWCGNLDLGTSNFLGWTLLTGATPSAPTLTS
ncbi:MAG: DUF2341 domain-containing protein [Candidatus Bathyarchaeia archaeon]